MEFINIFNIQNHGYFNQKDHHNNDIWLEHVYANFMDI